MRPISAKICGDWSSAASACATPSTKSQKPSFDVAGCASAIPPPRASAAIVMMRLISEQERLSTDEQYVVRRGVAVLGVELQLDHLTAQHLVLVRVLELHLAGEDLEDLADMVT